jgi:hypothetical protein
MMVPLPLSTIPGMTCDQWHMHDVTRLTEAEVEEF